MFEFLTGKTGKPNVAYRCPKLNCGADIGNLELMSGGIGTDARGRINSKMQIKCRICGTQHTTRPSGKFAESVFMALQGTEKLKRQMASAAMQKRTIRYDS